MINSRDCVMKKKVGSPLAEFFIPGQTIGIVGGNENARFIALAAKSIGYRVGVLAPSNECPAAEVADWQIIGDSTKLVSMLELANNSDLVTVVDELVELTMLDQLNSLVPLPQTYTFIEVCQNRLLEKEFLESCNLNLVPYGLVNELGDIHKLSSSIGFPSILKVASPLVNEETQHYLESSADLPGCIPLLSAGTCLLEAAIPFKKEIVVSIAANGDGKTVTFPLMESIYNQEKELQGYQLVEDLTLEFEGEIQRMAELIALSFNLQGVCSIELLLAENDILYVNSLSVGPHKAGFGTLEMTNYSQFEAHVRGLCGWPLPRVELFSKGLVFPIKGERLVESLGEIPFNSNWFHHYYGGSLSNPTESVGHITVLTEDQQHELMVLKEKNIVSL